MQSKSESRCTNAASRRLVVYFVSILIPGLLIVFCSSCSNLVFGVDGEDTVDAADAAGRQEARQRAEGLLDQHRSLIREIDAALVRIDRGGYGIDEVSGEPIGHARLALVPWARTSGARP